MIDITDKIRTLRVAKAQAIVKVSPETIGVVRSGKVPKGDVFDVSRAVGIMGAKRVSDVLPFCHPIPVEWVDVSFEVMDDGIIRIFVVVKSVSKTGCEMEALYGAMLTALNIYDMLKPIDKNVEITDIKLVEKSGGKSDFVEEVSEGFRAGVLVISDSVSAGKKSDKSGRIIVERLKSYGIANIEYKVVPDEKDVITSEVLKWCEGGIDLILTTGGTGLSPRDTTPEAIKPLLEKEVNGIMEAARSYGQERTPYAMMSRGIAGIRGKTLIVALPGSSRGVAESLNAIFPYILHIFRVMKMQPH